MEESSSLTIRRAPAGFRLARVKRFARLLAERVSRGPFDCLLTGDAEMRKLNAQFRDKDATTDVLSFPSATARYGGDLAISLARARAQARERGHSIEDEVCILMLHGVLHLNGMDHETDKGRMARAERKWRCELGLPDGLIERARSE